MENSVYKPPHDYPVHDPPLEWREVRELASPGWFRWQGGIYQLDITHFGYRREIREWCDENIPKSHLRDFPKLWGDLLYFKTEEDAMAFKMRWL